MWIPGGISDGQLLSSYAWLPLRFFSAFLSTTCFVSTFSLSSKAVALTLSELYWWRDSTSLRSSMLPLQRLRGNLFNFITMWIFQDQLDPCASQTGILNVVYYIYYILYNEVGGHAVGISGANACTERIRAPSWGISVSTQTLVKAYYLKIKTNTYGGEWKFPPKIESLNKKERENFMEICPPLFSQSKSPDAPENTLTCLCC